MLADMARAHYPALALDLRGHGESPLGDPHYFSVATLVADIREAVKAHGVSQPFVLVGHSMGGRVVMRYAADYPEDIAALVIEDIGTDKMPAPTPDEENFCRDAEVQPSMRLVV